MIRFVSVLCLTIAIAGCAHDIRVRFPSDPAEPTGTVTLVFTQAASDVVVAVNGVLVVNGEHTGRVEIDGIPTGTAQLAVAAGPGEKEMSVWVSSENPTTIPMGYPGGSTGDAIKGILGTLITVVVYSLLH